MHIAGSPGWTILITMQYCVESSCISAYTLCVRHISPLIVVTRSQSFHVTCFTWSPCTLYTLTSRTLMALAYSLILYNTLAFHMIHYLAPYRNHTKKPLMTALRVSFRVLHFCLFTRQSVFCTKFSRKLRGNTRYIVHSVMLAVHGMCVCGGGEFG